MHQHQTIEETDEERMSHEEQGTRNEDEKPKEKKMYKKLLDYWQIIVKLLELSICIICSALVIDPLRRIHTSSYMHHFSLMFTTFTGYILIITTFLLGRIFGDRLPFKTSFLFSLVGSGLFLTTGCLILSDRTDFSRKSIFHPNSYLLDMLCTSGALAICNAFIMALDAIFTLRMQKDL